MSRLVVVAGTGSGVGKTTVTLGLLEAFRRRGLRVQAFKVGPDFIDAGLHEVVTGRPSWTLDGWMCGREHVVATVARRAADADLAVVEGVMGCFDGAGAGGEGSTAEAARWLGAPVLLVVDARAQARSAAAVVRGFEVFDPDLRIAGVVLNRMGGAAHARLVAEAIGAACRAAPVGSLADDPALALPERHLGLVTAPEGRLTPRWRDRLAAAVEAGLDLDRLLALAGPLPAPAAEAPPAPAAGRVRIGVARDEAFQFYYPENLGRLAAAGAELVPWSPLADPAPPEVDGLYLGGGYPELHGRRLADNRTALDAVAAFAARGGPVYAECGGLMYLAESLEDLDGAVHRMAGVLPARVRMRPPRLAIGYAEVRQVASSPLGPAGTAARGHEFHCSTLDPVPAAVARVYRARAVGGEERDEGYLVGRTLMSYVHLHFGSNPALAPALVASCRAAGGGRRC